MGLSRTVSEIYGDFSRKSKKKFPTPFYFASPLKAFPLELGIGVGGKKLEWWGYRDNKKVWRYLQSCGYYAPTRQTDRRGDRHRATAKTALTQSVAQ